MYLIGDIGNTEIKICLVNLRYKIVKKIILKTELISKIYLDKKLKFIIKKQLENYIYNILSTLAVISVYFDLEKLDKFFFNDYKFPEGRGDIKLINLKTKDEECDLNYTPNNAVNKDMNIAMSNSFGFGGHNGVLVFSKT